jgi:hypothetical protein
MHRKDPLHDVPPIKLSFRITGLLELSRDIQNLEGMD